MVTLTCTLYTPYEMQAMLVGLLRVDMVQLTRVNPKIPMLYASGVRYKREPPGEEKWKSALQTLHDGFGDCEDLAAWRAAELRVSGIDPRANAVLKMVRPGLIHCLVKRSDGSIEDPSRKLGMNGRG